MAIDDAGIDKPYPTQIILLHGQTGETDGDRTEQPEGWLVGDSPPQPRTIAKAITETADHDTI